MCPFEAQKSDTLEKNTRVGLETDALYTSILCTHNWHLCSGEMMLTKLACVDGIYRAQSVEVKLRRQEKWVQPGSVGEKGCGAGGERPRNVSDPECANQDRQNTP